MPSNGMQVTGVQDHRRATGIFNNTQSSLAHKATLSNVSAGLATIGNSVDARVCGPFNNFAGQAIADHHPEAGNVTPLAARSAFHAALLCLYAQNSLGASPGFSSPRQIEADAQNNSSTRVASHQFDLGSTTDYSLPPVSADVVKAGSRQIVGAGPFEGVGAQPATPLIPSDVKQSRAIATYLGQLGNSLMSAGVLGFLRQHPGRTAAISVAAGLGTMAIAKGLGAFSSEPPVFGVSVVKQLATVQLPNGETLDKAVRNAIHGCAGNSSCERDAVANLLDPYKAQLGYAAQASDWGSVELSGVLAMPLIPDLVWGAYISTIVDAYHQWDAQSFLSDVELISRMPTNDDRRDAIVNMLGERGFTPQIRPFTHQLTEWLASGVDPVSGTNIIADVTAPKSNTQAPVLLLGAHYDKIGAGSEGAYDNGSGCAVVLELARRLQELPPENCQIKMAFFGEEETGLNGSSALVQECRDENNCPAMMINIDLAAGGNQIYAGSSNASHMFALFAGDPDAAMVPVTEQPLETRFLDGMRAAANGSTLKVVQNKGTPASDHLAYQFSGQPAVGICLLKEGQPAEMARGAQASAAVMRTGNAIDWASLEPLQLELDEALESDDGDPGRIANARNNYLSEARKQPFNPYIVAIDEQMRAHEESTVSQTLHSANDTLALIRPREVAKFIDVMEQGIRNFCQQLPAST